MTNSGGKPEYAEWKDGMRNKGKVTEQEYLGVDTCELLTDRSRWSWRKDAYRGRIASIKLGRRLLIPRSEVERLMQENTRPRLEDK